MLRKGSDRMLISKPVAQAVKVDPAYIEVRRPRAGVLARPICEPCHARGGGTVRGRGLAAGAGWLMVGAGAAGAG